MGFISAHDGLIFIYIIVTEVNTNSNMSIMKNMLLISILFCSISVFGQKALIKDNQVVTTVIPSKFERENGQTVWGGYRDLPDSIHYADGWRDIIMPEIDYYTQRLGQRYYNQAMDAVTYTVINKTVEELQTEKEAVLDAIDNDMDIMAMKRLLRILTKNVLESDSVTEQQLSDIATIYPQWRVNKYYQTNEIFVKDSLLFRVIQAHTSQADWQPETTASLYTPYRPAGEITDWVQPTGAHDAYMKGEKVRYNGNTFESVIDNNTWSPAAYPAGWKQI